MKPENQKIASRLSEYTDEIKSDELFPTLVPEALGSNINNPYAFCLATCLDRGTLAELIWTIPYWIQQDLGHLDPYKINQMTIEQLDSLVNRLPKKPRYVDAAPRTIHEITKIIVEEFNGDATRIWAGRRSADVRKVFLRVYGVGPGIANMAVILIEKAFRVRFPDLDRPDMDIKPDVNTMRVLYRLGVAAIVDPTEAILAARRLNPGFPGEIDGALWMIGKHWCKASNPNCRQCPVTEVCPKQID